MIDDSRHIRSGVEGIRGKKENSTVKSKTRIRSLLTSSEVLIPVGSAILQIKVGLALVAVSILGLVSPLWLSALLSLAGSASCMAGIFLVYHTFSTSGTFESLINQAIRRVINAQN
jgi:hypothetical protein